MGAIGEEKEGILTHNSFSSISSSASCLLCFSSAESSQVKSLTMNLSSNISLYVPSLFTDKIEEARDLLVFSTLVDKVVSNLFKYGNSLQNVLIIRSDLSEHCRKNIISLAVTTFFHRKHSLGAPGHDHACQTFILIGPILCEVPVTLRQIGTWIRIWPPSLSPNQWEDRRK